MATFTASEAFESSAAANTVDPLRLILIVAAALTMGLIVRELVLRWHDWSSLLVLGGTVTLGTPFLVVEMYAFGEPYTWRLGACFLGLAFVASGVVRARRLRRTVRRATAVGAAKHTVAYTVPSRYGDRAIGVARTGYMPQRVVAMRAARTHHASGPVIVRVK